MMNIKIICVGKIKEPALQSLCGEYLKRLSKYAKLEIIELQDEKLPTTLSEKQILDIQEIESERIIQKINKLGKCSVILLDLNGVELDSKEFSNKLQNLATYENSTIVFVIGGSLGMSPSLLQKPYLKICFSKMTFPHQLIRVFLLEQIFRAFKIQNNETYHH